jgi:hypothetical protein
MGLLVAKRRAGRAARGLLGKALASAALVVAAAALVVASAGCGTPRERDCRVLRPRLDEAEAATGFVGNARPSVTNLFAMQAARSAAAARWLEGATLETELARDVPPLVAALGRHAELAKRVDGSLRVLGFHVVDGGAAPGPALARALAIDGGERSPLVDDLVTLDQRCGIFLAAPAAEHAECKQLAAVFAHFFAPADDLILASAHTADCLNELAAVHAAAPDVERAIRSLEAVLRDAAHLAGAALADGPAVRIVAELRALAKAGGEQRGAQAEVAQKAAALRTACVGGAAPRRP